MKPYVKPKLIALSLNGNERLCGDCADNGAGTLLYNDSGLSLFMQAFYGFGDNDGISEKSDFIGVFGTNEGCTKGNIDDYCKFTYNGRLVAWS